MMVSNAARYLEQPAGGFVNPHAMGVFELNNSDVLFPDEMEDITGGEIGMVVDYLSRYMLTGNIEEAFSISLKGAERGGVASDAQLLLGKIHGVDSDSVAAAVKLVSCDVFIRNPIGVAMGGWHPTTKVSNESVSNIQIMVKRCLQLFEEYGPVKKCGPIFPGAYTKNIDSGDADYMTFDTIWDIKCTRKDVGIQDTFQLLMYYLLSQHSDGDKYKSIKKIGIYNPRLNKGHLISVADIDDRILRYVSKYIIGYTDTEEVTLKDLKEALESRPQYSHYHKKRGTESLVEQLVKLDCTEFEKLYILRTTKAEFVRQKLAECIESEKLTISKDIYTRECEIMQSYNEKPNQVALHVLSNIIQHK